MFNFISNQYIDSPKERQLARELQNMQLQYELLNKRMDDAIAALENVEERDNAIYRLYFEANPIPEEQRRAGFGGVNRYKKFEGYDNSQLIAESNKRLDILEKAIVVQSKSLFFLYFTLMAPAKNFSCCVNLDTTIACRLFLYSFF